jgi:hypothetical protein
MTSSEEQRAKILAHTLAARANEQRMMASLVELLGIARELKAHLLPPEKKAR